MADVNANIGVNIDTSEALAQLKALQRQISQFHTSIAKSSETAALAQRDLQRNFINSVNALGAFSAELRTVRTTAESFTDSLEKNKFSMREYFRYAGGATRTFGRLFKSEFDTIGKVAEDRVKKLQTQYIKLGRDTTGAMRAIAVIPNELDLNNYSTQTQLAAQRQAIFNQLIKQGSTNLLNFGKNTQWAGRQLMVGFTLPLASLGVTAARTFMDMETAALKFRKVYGDLFTPREETQQALADVTALGEMFTRYGIAVSSTVGLAAEAAAAGFQGIDLQRQTAQATRLSVLGQIEQQKALETTISLQNAFKMSSADLAGSIDFLNAVENQTVVSLDDITTAIPKVAPVIQQLGGDVKDLAFFMAAMKEGGINASEGANALKSGLASLINPTEKAAAMLSNMGINIKQIVEANKGDLKATVIAFAQALDTLDPLTRARAIEQLFGKFQFARLSTLFDNVTNQTGQAARVLDLAGTSIEDLAALSEQELGMTADSAMNKFRKSVEDLKMSLVPVGQTFLEAVTPIVEFIGGILEKFNNLSSGVKKAIVVLTVAIGAIGPVALMTFGLLANGLANIVKGAMILRQGYLRLTGQSQILGEQTEYLTTEQINATSVAHSLDQSHARLIQTFTSETNALKELINVYQNATRAGANFAMQNPGMMIPPRRRFNKGVTIVPGSGNRDTVAAMLTPGEAVIPKDKAKKYAPLIEGMIAGNIPGYMAGTVSVGGRATGLDFARSDTAAKAQRLIDAMLADGAGIENAMTIVEETLSRMANDTKISIDSFVRELDLVTKSLTGKQLPGSVFKAAGRGERRFSAGQTGIGTMEQQVAGNAVLQEELSRARGSASAAQQAMVEYYQSIGKDAGEFSNVVQQAGDVHRAHVIDIRDNVDKMFMEAWDPKAWVAQSSTLNQVSNILQSSKSTRDEYFKNLSEINADETVVASIMEKITNNIALTEQELGVQKQVLERMLASTSSMAKVAPNFGPQAAGAVAATNYLIQNPATQSGVGTRSAQQTAAAQQALAQAKFRGQGSFVPVTQAAQTLTNQVVLETARAAGTQSPSKRTIPIGEDIARGLSVGMMNQADDVAATAQGLAQSATGAMRDTGLFGPKGEPLRVPVSQGATINDIAARSSISAPIKEAMDEEVKTRRITQQNLSKLNATLMSSVFALTSLAGAGSFASGTIGNISQAIFKYSGILFALMSVTQLLTQAKIAELAATRLAVAKQAMAFATYGKGLSSKAGLLGSIAKLGVGITRFLGPIGVATTVLGLAVAAYKWNNRRLEENRKKLEAFGDAVSTSAEQLKTLGDYFGVVPQQSPLETAKLLEVAAPQVRTAREQFKASEQFKQFLPTVEAVQRLDNDQARQALQFKGIELLGRGFTKEQVQIIIDSIREEAGKLDLQLDFKNIKFNQEQVDQIGKDLDVTMQGFNEAFKKGVSEQTLAAYDAYTQKWVTTTKKVISPEATAALNNQGKAMKAYLVGLSGMLQNGTISTKKFDSMFIKFTNTIMDKIPDSTTQIRLLNATLSQMESPLAKSALGINNAKDKLLLLQAAMVNVTSITPAMIAQLEAAGRSADGGAQRAASRVRARIAKEIAENKRAINAALEAAADAGTVGGGTGGEKFSLTKFLNENIKALNTQTEAFKAMRVAGLSAAAAAELASNPDAAKAIVALAKAGGQAWKDATALIRNYRKEQVELEKILKAGASAGEYELNRLTTAEKFIALQEKLIDLQNASKLKKYNDELNFQNLILKNIESRIKAVTDAELIPRETLIKQNNYKLEQIAFLEDGINKKYDEQEKILARIYEANQDILSLQKSRLSVADALTRGDISAAATAAEELRAQQISVNQSRQSKVLQTAREQELLALGRNTLEKQNQIIQLQISEIQQKQLDAMEMAKQKISDQIDALNDQVYITEKIMEMQKDSITYFGMTKQQIQDAVSLLQTARDAGINIDVKENLTAFISAAKGDMASLNTLLNTTVPAAAKAAFDELQKLRDSMDLSATITVTTKADGAVASVEAVTAALNALNAAAANAATSAIIQAQVTINQTDFDTINAAWGAAKLSAQAYFDAVAAWADGVITPDEIEAFAKKWGIPTSAAQAYFDAVKALADGVISDAEIAAFATKWGIPTSAAAAYFAKVAEDAGVEIDTSALTKYGSAWSTPTDAASKYFTSVTTGIESLNKLDYSSPGQSAAGGWNAATAAAQAYTAAAAAAASAQRDLAAAIAATAAATAAAKTTTSSTSSTEAKTVYTVKPGDTLSAIAAANGVTVGDLLAANPKFEDDPKYDDGNMIWSGTTVVIPKKKNRGGIISGPSYMRVGGFAMGSDIVPAMLTPGEFVVRRPAVQNFGVENLEKINSGNYDGDSVYNYSISVNVNSNSNPNEIARTVMTQIKQIDSQRIRGQRA